MSPPIVGIGASAGGLEALERFFRAASTDVGAAYVVIQHLSPNFESMMDELLARCTAMPVARAEHGQRLVANRVYVLGPRMEATVRDGVLQLVERERTTELRRPIDTFFGALAADAGPRAVGCILSGTGSDGSRGVREIHDAGGLVVCQSPDSARFDGMPRSAIDTQVADLVLPPGAMSEAIARYLSHLEADGFVHRPTPPDEDGRMARVLAMLLEECGIDFGDYKHTTVQRRIERRVFLKDASGLGDYVQRLETDPHERRALYHDLLIGVTKFFRDAPAFDLLAETVLPELVDGLPPGQELRVWVPGCATGEEAYSLAMLCHETFRRVGRTPAVKIFATDVHRASLDTASAALYSATTIAEVSPARRERFLRRHGDSWRVADEIRQHVVFAQHNVIADAPFTRLHLVSCRNLLIYLRPRTQRRVLSLFLFALQRNGVLFLGKSENPRTIAEGLEVIGERERIFRKVEETPLPDDLRWRKLEDGMPHPSPLMAPRRAEPRSTPPLLRTYDALLDRFLPPSLLISHRGELVHSFAGGAQYLSLSDGRPSTGVIDLLVPSLRTAVAGAMQRVIHKEEPLTLTGVQAGEGGPVLRITAEPIANRGQARPDHVLVSFERNEVAVSTTRPPDETDVGELSRERIVALEQELQHSRESLQATIEELEASNEELQASNEELVASNEELQSTNEELQSVNEELYTVNAELQKKLTEYTELARDMDHLLSSMEVGTLFLDANLRVRKVTAMATRLFSLQPQDVGRAISDFQHRLDHPALLEDVTRILDGTERIDRDVRDADGNWYLLRIRPYLVKEAREGIVLTLIDVAALKEAEDQVRKAVVRRDEFLALLSHELRNPVAAILNASQVLSRLLAGDDRSGRAIGVIERQTAQMGRLLDDLLDVSRMTRNKLPLVRSVLDVRDVVRQSVEGAVRPAAFRIETELAEDPLLVDADPARLLQVMANLLSNAIRYNDPTGRVWIRAYRELGDVVVRVRDDGIGMSEDFLGTVFEPFVQSERGLSRSEGGMGVGLALVRAIVQLHGGSVRAHSEGHGKGSEFVVRVPAALEALAPEPPAAPPPLAFRPRVLLVEDDADSREMLSDLLRHEGFELEAVADGRAAIDALATGAYDLALVDIGLPEVDGYEVARTARAGGCAARLVALTGYGFGKDRERAMRAGFDEHIVKPVALPRLRELFASLL